jgi:two-component system chemotaxis sensor kinase CheA
VPRRSKKGLITDEEANTMDERQSLNLVFLPGFSTAAKVSDVSGRGVGMDVVKTNIQKLNGSHRHPSEQGKGTTFIISLPLTLAILPVLLVRWASSPSPCRCRWCAKSCRSSRRHPGSRRPRDHGRARRGAAGLPLARLLGWPQKNYAAVRRADADGRISPSSWRSTTSPVAKMP